MKSTSPFSFEKNAYIWLEDALDCGISELTYWDMTLAEIARAISSHNRVKKAQAQERAGYDYILADLIGRSVSRIYGSSNKMPPLQEIYSSLFDSKAIEAQQQQRQDELSAIRFRQFANAYNKKFQGGGCSE